MPFSSFQLKENEKIRKKVIKTSKAEPPKKEDQKNFKKPLNIAFKFAIMIFVWNLRKERRDIK